MYPDLSFPKLMHSFSYTRNLLNRGEIEYVIYFEIVLPHFQVMLFFRFLIVVQYV